MRLAAEADRLDDLRARYTTADRDLPERRLRLREADLKVRDILVRIERPDEADPHRLILGASIVGQLRDFIEERSGIEARKTAALAEYEAARHRLDEAEAALRNAGDGSETAENHAAMSLLATTLAALRADDHAARRRLAERSRAKHRAELDERLGALRPWTGDAGALAGLAVPEAPDLERWKTVLAAAEKRLSACTAEVDGLTAKHARMEAELVAIGSVAHLIGDREATTIRAGREKAWSSHRRTLDAASADLFEAAMREDDIVTNARLGHAAEVAKLNRLRQDLAADESTLARARDLQAAAAADVSRVRGEIAAAVAGALPGFAGDTLLPQLEAWLGRREKALETRAALREAEHELYAADADAASARERLATALAAAGIPHDVASGFDTLSAVALSALDRETSLRTLREAVEGCRRDVARRERGAKDAGRADDVWAAGWKHACAGCWLGEDGTAPSLATVRESLDVIAGLGPALDARAGLADRIEKMERDQAAFAAQVASAEAALGLADTSSPVLQRAQAIAERIEEARDARARKAEKASDLERMRGHQRKLAVERDELNRRKAAMTAHFGVDTLAEVDAKLRDIAHKAETRRPR